MGAYGLALRHAATQPAPRTTTRLTLGVTERFMVLASVSGLFALFLGLQVSYFFGDLPALAGSGVTYAEYARNGFGELTFAATAATLLLVWLDQHAERGKGEGRAGAAGLVLVFLVQLLLDSAYHRVSLYEAAYGYTAARLYARVYMMVVSVSLIALGIELWAQVDAARLVRRVSLLGVAAVVALSCWNYEAWIVRKNVDRFIAPHYGELDTSYLVYDLSPNAVPEIVRQLPRIPGAYRTRSRRPRKEVLRKPGSLGLPLVRVHVARARGAKRAGLDRHHGHSAEPAARSVAARSVAARSLAQRVEAAVEIHGDPLMRHALNI